MLNIKTQPICLFGLPSDANGGAFENALDGSSDVWSAHETFPSVSGQGESLVEATLHELETRGWSPVDLFQVQLALEEGIANAIEHGNKHDPNKFVHMDVELDDARILVKIQDEGEGFPHWALPDPTDEANLDKPSGRGVFLIRNSMTKVWFNDKGTCIFMEKNPTPLESFSIEGAQETSSSDESIASESVDE